MVRAIPIVLLCVACIATAAGQQLRWRGYPAPRSGIILLELDRAGNVTRVRIAKSFGDAALDASAIAKFSKWHLKPGTASPVRIRVTYSVAGTTTDL